MQRATRIGLALLALAPLFGSCATAGAIERITGIGSEQSGPTYVLEGFPEGAFDTGGQFESVGKAALTGLGTGVAFKNLGDAGGKESLLAGLVVGGIEYAADRSNAEAERRADVARFIQSRGKELEPTVSDPSNTRFTKRVRVDEPGMLPFVAFITEEYEGFPPKVARVRIVYGGPANGSSPVAAR